MVDLANSAANDSGFYTLFEKARRLDLNTTVAAARFLAKVQMSPKGGYVKDIYDSTRLFETAL